MANNGKTQQASNAATGVAIGSRTWIAIATLVTLSVYAADVCGADRLPEQIPKQSIATEQAVRKIILAVEQIEDAQQRQSALRTVSYDLYSLKLAQHVSNADELQDALWKLSNPKSGRPPPSVLRRMQPESASEEIRRIRDVKLRDGCLYEYVLQNPQRESKELLPLIRQIEDSSMRGSALFSLLRNEQVTTERAKEYLEDVRRLPNPTEAAGGKYALGMILSRIAKDDADAAAQFLSEVLPPEDAVIAIGHAAIYCDFQQKSPTAAARLLGIAAEMVPTCADPRTATESLLHCWLAKHHPKLALELYDRFLEPGVLQTPDYPISYLWPAGVAATLERAERYCVKRGRPSEFVVSSVLGRIASFEKPDLAIQWLDRAEPSPLRDKATVKISQGLVHHVHKRDTERAKLVQWVDVLRKFTLAIKDGESRAKGCEQLSFLVQVMRAEPPIELPQSIRDEYLTLWPEIRTKLEAKKKWDLHHVRYDLAPRDVLDEALRESFSKAETRFVAGLVHNSNLTAEEKAGWNAAILAQARVISDPQKKAIALTRLANLWRSGDSEVSLQLALDSLRIAQSLGLKRVNGFEGVEEPYATMDDALRFGLERLPANENSVQSLWKFASRLDAMDERDAVLEALVEVLLRAKDTARAAGVTKLITAPARRARAWGAIAVVTSGKPLRVDW